MTEPTDTERLDFLELQQCGVYCWQRWRRKVDNHGPHNDRTAVIQWSVGADKTEYRDLRAAIDAAIERANQDG